MSRRSRWIWLILGSLVTGLVLAFAAIRIRPKTPPAVTSKSSFEFAWMYEAAEPGAVISTPLIDGDRIFVGKIHDAGFTPRGAVVCLNGDTGKPIWKFDDGGRMIHMYSSPRLSDGRLYIGEGMHANFECKLYCLNADTGRKLWDFPAEGHIESTPCLADGKVFFGAGDAGLFAVDAKTGLQRWQFSGPWHIDSTPAVSDGRVFVGSGVSRRFKEAVLFCLNANDKQIVWRVPVDLPAWGSPVVDQGQVFFGLGNGRLDSSDDHPAGALICLAASSGHELWRYRVPDGVLARPCVDGTRVYFSSRDGAVTALDRVRGQFLWSQLLSSPVVTSPVCVGDRLFVTASAGTLVSINADTGDILSTFDLAARYHCAVRMFSSPAVVSDSGTGRHFIAFGAEFQMAAHNVAAVIAVRD